MSRSPSHSIQDASSLIAGTSAWPIDVYPPPLTFPTSNVRAEPIQRPPTQQALPANPSPSVSRASVPRPIPSVSQSASQPVLITAQNPFVALYIDKLAHWKTNGVLPPRLVGVDRPRVNKKQRMSEACWVTSVANVNAVLDHTRDLPKVECMCVLALAALVLFESPTFVAFPALWGEGVYKQTAELVQKVCYGLKPCPIRPPIFWLGLPEMKFYFNMHIKPRIPKKAPPKPAHREVEASTVDVPVLEPLEIGGRLLRGRKAVEATRALAPVSRKTKGKRNASASDVSEAEEEVEECLAEVSSPSIAHTRVTPHEIRSQAKRARQTHEHGIASTIGGDDAVAPPEDEPSRVSSALADSQPPLQKPMTRQAKNEYLDSASVIPPAAIDVNTGSEKSTPPVPTRRSTRQRRSAGTSTLPPPSAIQDSLSLASNIQRALAFNALSAALPPTPKPVSTRSRSSSAHTSMSSGTAVDSEDTAVDDDAEHVDARPFAKALGKRKAAVLDGDAEGAPARRTRQRRPPLAVSVALAQMNGTPVQTRARSRAGGRA